MTKKIIAALLAAVMVLGMFAGCGTTEPAAPADVSDESVQNAAVSEEDSESENTADTQGSEPKIELSGNAEDKFIAAEDCYAESERVIMFIKKGREVSGDMLKLTEMAMDDICAVTGLTFERNYNDGLTDDLSFYFGEGAFKEVNYNYEKVYVILTDLSESIPTASESGVVLDISDYNYEETGYQALYHELTHVIHLMNGANLGSTLTEGFAVYFSEKALMHRKLTVWNSYQYYFPYGFDESAVAKGEEGFDYGYSSEDFNYHYGFRFLHFLNDTYGEDCIFKILRKASNERFSPAYTVDGPENQEELKNEQMISIIKSQTDEDVFEKFAKWSSQHWSEKAAAFDKYHVSIGADSVL